MCWACGARDAHSERRVGHDGRKRRSPPPRASEDAIIAKRKACDGTTVVHPGSQEGCGWCSRTSEAPHDEFDAGSGSNAYLLPRQSSDRPSTCSHRPFTSNSTTISGSVLNRSAWTALQSCPELRGLRWPCSLRLACSSGSGRPSTCRPGRPCSRRSSACCRWLSLCSLLSATCGFAITWKS
jgi:hypothetical protein